MISNRFDRKKFLATIASGVIGGLCIPSAIAQVDSLYSSQDIFNTEKEVDFVADTMRKELRK